MIAADASHDELLIAIVGGLALILVGIAPLLVNSYRQRRQMGDMATQLPPNGTTLAANVEKLKDQSSAQSRQLSDLSYQVAKVEASFVLHIRDIEDVRAWAENEMRERAERTSKTRSDNPPN